jgi:hypothetical protein
MIRMALWLSCIVAVAFTALPASWAWEVVTHRALTKKAIFTVEDVLAPAIRAQLGYQDGIDHPLDRVSILDWMQDGAEAEDIPGIRVRNHFHNPRQPLEQAGLSDAYFAQLSLGLSAVEWAKFAGWRSAC